MLYPYMTLGNGTEILHTGIKETDEEEKVEVHFERPIEGRIHDCKICFTNI